MGFLCLISPKLPGSWSSSLKLELPLSVGLSCLPYSTAKRDYKVDADTVLCYCALQIFICALENGLKFSMESADRKVNNYAK